MHLSKVYDETRFGLLLETDVDPEESAAIARAYKRQLSGAGAAGFGYGAGEVDEDGNFSIGGIRLPELLSHSPVLEIAKVGAKARQSKHSGKESVKKLVELILTNGPGSEIGKAAFSALYKSYPELAKEVKTYLRGNVLPQIYLDAEKATRKRYIE
ncbi:MAG TPA: hypothetical protein VK171_07085 [Fimbriimonas sp.]|nr:hypothetical protein [Fimbriimonas sp.]